MTVEIENDFTFNINGTALTIKVQEPKTLGEVLGVLNKPVSNIRIFKTGKIEVHAESFQIIVEPASAYEAWQIYADNGLRIICVPDGDLAIWLPE
jgi:hypothetical protein